MKDLRPSPRRQPQLLLSMCLAALIFFGVAAKGTALRGPAEADEPSGAVEVFPVGALTCELHCGFSKHVCWNYANVISQLVHCLRSQSFSTKWEPALRRSGPAVLIRPPLSHITIGGRFSFLRARSRVKRETAAIKLKIRCSRSWSGRHHQSHLNEAVRCLFLLSSIYIV